METVRIGLCDLLVELCRDLVLVHVVDPIFSNLPRVGDAQRFRAMLAA